MGAAKSQQGLIQGTDKRPREAFLQGPSPGSHGISQQCWGSLAIVPGVRHAGLCRQHPPAVRS